MSFSIYAVAILFLSSIGFAQVSDSSLRSDQLATTKHPLPHQRLARGALAPDFELPSVGKRGTLKRSDFEGRFLLLIFFDPTCPYCLKLVDELSKTSMQNDPEVLLISSGSNEQNEKFFREHPVPCPVVLQTSQTTAVQYGIDATPQAYLVDKHGYVASDLIHGAELLRTFAKSSTSKEK